MREASQAKQKSNRAYSEKATHQIAKISHPWFNVLSGKAWSARGSVFDAFDAATG
jgi:hypothetical protein